MISQTVDVKTNKIGFSEILSSERPFAFRLPNSAKDATLKAEIAMLGLLYPITVETVNPGQCVILDGYRRFDAIHKLRQEQGGWEDIPVLIFQQNQLLTHEKLILLNEKNSAGENAYTVYEKALLFDAFQKRGLSVEEIAEHTRMNAEDVRLLIYLAEAPNPLSGIVIDSGMSEAYALALLGRHREWAASPYKDDADGTARKIAAYLKEENVSPRGWQFLLDFYWSERPFMAPRLPNTE